uniref:Transcriptional regulator, contains XRE-family HTH domain n=1 Tax=Candidatus Kentrum sp. LPFa TaxID=2126335 RepID=A0A450WD95_9GAMM|nr:MAG: Transcriptional regulator, contains XRE-family HTH domain [Candidatus Kentron sp. LPFa]
MTRSATQKLSPHLTQNITRIAAQATPMARVLCDIVGGMSKRLTEERLRLGLTHEEFANRLGLDPSEQAHREAGEVMPTPEHLTRLAKLGVDIGYVITGDAKARDERLFLGQYRASDAPVRYSLDHLLDTVSQPDLAA